MAYLCRTFRTCCHDIGSALSNKRVAKSIENKVLRCVVKSSKTCAWVHSLRLPFENSTPVTQPVCSGPLSFLSHPATVLLVNKWPVSSGWKGSGKEKLMVVLVRMLPGVVLWGGCVCMFFYDIYVYASINVGVEHTHKPPYNKLGSSFRLSYILHAGL